MSLLYQISMVLLRGLLFRSFYSSLIWWSCGSLFFLSRLYHMNDECFFTGFNFISTTPTTLLVSLEICKITFSFSSSRTEMNRERKDGRKALECHFFGVSSVVPLSSIPPPNSIILISSRAQKKIDPIQSAHLIPLAFMHMWMKHQLDKKSVDVWQKLFTMDSECMLFWDQVVNFKTICPYWQRCLVWSGFGLVWIFFFRLGDRAKTCEFGGVWRGAKCEQEY